MMVTTPSVSAQEARGLILSGAAPRNLVVHDDLDLSGEQRLTALPAGLHVKSLRLNNCYMLESLPRGLQCYELVAQAVPLTSLPDDIEVSYRIDLSNCQRLERLPDGLKVSSLILHNCNALRQLPEDLDVFLLDISDCHTLENWPTHGPATLGRLNMRGCQRLRTLPPWLTTVAQLDISECVGLEALPEDLQVRSWIDLEETPLRALPPALQQVQLRWHNVRITQRIAFAPETITTDEILAEENAELRRVLTERMGHETFMSRVGATVLDEDQDAGGIRQLLHVEMKKDEPLVCLSVRCPSTGRGYMLRVPPTMQSCHQAAAWTAGFDNPDDYRPLAET